MGWTMTIFVRSSGRNWGEAHCYRSKPTEKYYPASTSDYYTIWLTDCGAHMFLKLLVDQTGTPQERLVVTSFKKDDRYDR